MAGYNEYVEMMRRALSLSEPDLDTTVGTTVRKLIDAVAEVAAAASVDNYLLDYVYDVDSKTGTDLDDFVRLFGFTRLPARRATGAVRFERQAAATTDILIGKGTQVGTQESPSVLAFTVVPAVLQVGQTLIEVPVQAVVAGSRGNVAAQTLEQVVQPINGISSFTNLAALTGGTDVESDQILRERFKKTIFRNLAGTEAMFMGVALENEYVSQVNVIGASKVRREQVEVVDGGAVSTVQDAAYIYDGTSVFGTDIDGGEILTPGVHYAFSPGIPPSVAEIVDGSLEDGIYDLVYEYVPIASRNEPEAGITNRVDIYVNGVKAVAATETRLFSSSLVFDEVTGSPYEIARFRRTDGTMPEAGNYFLPLAFSPVTDPSIDNEIVVGPNTYTEGTDFYLVNDVSDRGGAPESLSGIEWISDANGATTVVPDDEDPFVVDYVFNAVPRDVQVRLREWRLVTQDVWVHQAKVLLLNFHIAIILERGFSAAMVQAPIEQALSNLTSAVGFNGVLQVSDALSAVHNVPGVDAVRFINDTDDPTDFAIQEVASDGTTVLNTYEDNGRATDVFTGDDEVLAMNDVFLTVKAQNTWAGS